MSRERPMPSPLPEPPQYEPTTSWRLIAVIVFAMVVVVIGATFWLISM